MVCQGPENLQLLSSLQKPQRLLQLRVRGYASTGWLGRSLSRSVKAVLWECYRWKWIALSNAAGIYEVAIIMHSRDESLFEVDSMLYGDWLRKERSVHSVFRGHIKSSNALCNSVTLWQVSRLLQPWPLLTPGNISKDFRSASIHTGRLFWE